MILRDTNAAKPSAKIANVEGSGTLATCDVLTLSISNSSTNPPGFVESAENVSEDIPEKSITPKKPKAS